MYGVPIKVFPSGRSATIGGEIHIDGERYGVTVAHMFDEENPETVTNEDLIDLEFDEYSDDEWKASEANLNHLCPRSATSDKGIRLMEELKSESELKEAYKAFRKRPTSTGRSADQLIGSLEDPPKLHKAHDWALIKISADHALDAQKKFNVGKQESKKPLETASPTGKDTFVIGPDILSAEAFAAGVAAVISSKEGTSANLSGQTKDYRWAAKLSDNRITAQAFAVGVVSAIKLTSVAQYSTVMRPSMLTTPPADLPTGPPIKDNTKMIIKGPDSEGGDPEIPFEIDPRRFIGVPHSFTEHMPDEPVWIATGRGELLKARGIPSNCIINMRGMGFVEALTARLFDNTSTYPYAL